VTLLALLAAVALLVANGFFVAYEFAVVGSRRTKLETSAGEGDRRAQRALGAVSEVNLQLSGAQLGITMASLGLGAVAEPAVARLLQDVFGWTGISEALSHTLAFVVALTIVVFLHMVVGEMVPKNIALTGPESTLMSTVSLNRAYMVVFGPRVRALTWIADHGVRLFGLEPRAELMSAHTAEELASMLAASRREGVIEDFAADLMTGVLDFGGLAAGDVMVPRHEISYVRRAATAAETERLLLERGHSRLPVVGRDLDDVQGFIHSKDLLTLSAEEAERPLPPRMVRRMLVVPTERSLEDLLLSMRRTRVHFALVVDEAGATRGLVTLEDLLEELVGDILDESDRERGRTLRPPDRNR
jgi:CBS domain containing-hemolysin-like protein